MHLSISPTAEFLLHSLFVVLSVFGDKARLKSISRITTPYVAVLRCFANFVMGSITSVFIWLIRYVICGLIVVGLNEPCFVLTSFRPS